MGADAPELFGGPTEDLGLFRRLEPARPPTGGSASRPM
jgi:hypothetical protein